ncbi:sulfotransferase 1B1-like [Pleurodeles waltl]|uniref:sulfotransferase 1B1-like n=1 Tax=Pleurodeles waltl TaxID=8319 RepID=UPI0037098990
MEIPEEYHRNALKMVLGLPMVSSFADNWERIDKFQFYPDDVVIATYPKSGTTWMSEIIDLTLNDKDIKKCQRDAIYSRVVLLESAVGQAMETGTELISQMPSPRLLRTHLPITHLPKSFWENKCKIIYVARNAKDVAVSSYHFRLGNRLHREPGTLAEYLEDFMAGNVSFGSWFEHVKGWWLKRHELRLLYIFYEDMKEDLEREVRKLLTFLEKDMDEGVLKKIVHHASFEVMRDNPMTNYKTLPNELFDQDVSPFMRKGVSGDWKNHFSVALNERFDEDYGEKMKGSLMSF